VAFDEVQRGRQKAAGAFAGPSAGGELIAGNIGIVAQSGATSEAIATKILKKINALKPPPHD
jgi:hypothetical protein